MSSNLEDVGLVKTHWTWISCLHSFFSKFKRIVQHIGRFESEKGRLEREYILYDIRICYFVISINFNMYCISSQNAKMKLNVS